MVLVLSVDASTDSFEKKIGQMLMIGFQGLELVPQN